MKKDETNEGRNNLKGRTIRSAFPNVSLHLEVTVLGAEVDISSEHHLYVGLLLGERHGNRAMATAEDEDEDEDNGDGERRHRRSFNLQM